MPEKDGDEGKSTKSVVNKKQKQMMGEEGYDIARDMGRVRPSKDKKDATTMPVSDEVKKTQKVNKGPSALDIVKKKYKGQIMKMEELDLTQVAEAFGGHIVEANGKKKKPKPPFDPEAEGFGGKPGTPPQSVPPAPPSKSTGGSRPTSAQPEVGYGGKAGDKPSDLIGEPTPREIERQKFQVSRAEMQKTAPKPGERQKQREIVKKFMDARRTTPNVQKEPVRPVDPSFLDPKTNPFDTVPDAPKITGRKDASNRARAAQERRAVKGYDDILRAIRTGTTKTGADAEKVARGKGRSARRYRLSPEKQAERLAKVKADIDRRNPTFTSPVTGGKLPVGGADDYQRRLTKAYGQSVRGTVKTGQFPAGSPLPPAAEKPPEEPIPQKDQEQQRQQQQQQQQQQQRTYQDFNKELEGIYDPKERLRRFYEKQGKELPDQFKNREIGGGGGFEGPRGGGSGGGGTGGSGGGKGGSGGGGLSNTGGPLVPKGGDLTKTKEPSLVSKSPLGKVGQFAKDNPALSIAAYDLGKGILSKIMKLRGPGVRGGTVGRRSAGSFTAT